MGIAAIGCAVSLHHIVFCTQRKECQCSCLPID
jgi:hypothetical protein